MEFDSVIEGRRSVHSFKDKKPSWKSIIEAVDSACQGPFADGLNNLKFLIIEEKETIDKIAEISDQLWINQSQLLVVICSDDTNLENLHGERGRVYSRQQAGAAIENFLLKLTDLGLAGCWVGSYTDELLKQLLKIPSHIQIEAIVPVGYESGKAPKKRKKPLEAALFWEEWDQKKRPSLVQEDKDIYGVD